MSHCVEFSNPLTSFSSHWWQMLEQTWAMLMSQLSQNSHDVKSWKVWILSTPTPHYEGLKTILRTWAWGKKKRTWAWNWIKRWIKRSREHKRCKQLQTLFKKMVKEWRGFFPKASQIMEVDTQIHMYLKKKNQTWHWTESWKTSNIKASWGILGETGFWCLAS